MTCSPLSDNDILTAWEAGQHRLPVHRALILLARARPEMTWDQLTALSIGERDAGLLALRERTYGPDLNVFTHCPECGQDLEFTLQTTAIMPPLPDSHERSDKEHVAFIDGRKVRYRLPNSADLEAIDGCRNAAQGQELLIRRCVLEIEQSFSSNKDEMETSTSFASQIAEHMSEQDPQAEVLLNLHCSECARHWQALFDIAAFFWAELEQHAKRLLGEIHVLARAYGWREQDILSLSRIRRRWYMDMALA